MTVEKCLRPHHLLRRGERCPTCKGDVLTCLACGVNGVGIGFEHKCDPLAVREERTRIVARLRARATAEQVTAYRWAQSGNARVEALHQKAADVLLEECDRLERGV